MPITSEPKFLAAYNVTNLLIHQNQFSLISVYFAVTGKYGHGYFYTHPDIQLLCLGIMDNNNENHGPCERNPCICICFGTIFFYNKTQSLSSVT